VLLPLGLLPGGPQPRQTRRPSPRRWSPAGLAGVQPRQIRHKIRDMERLSYTGTLRFGLTYCGWGRSAYAAILAQPELTWDGWLAVVRIDALSVGPHISQVEESPSACGERPSPELQFGSHSMYDARRLGGRTGSMRR
jgi:hypothetical protein